MGDWDIEFWEDATGEKPVYEWLMEELAPHERRAVGHAMRHVLQKLGPAVCSSKHWGRHLGDGLFEFKLRHSLYTMNRLIAESQGKDPSTIKRQDFDGEEIVFRVFCHAHGDQIILLLHAYDKGADPSEKRQTKEIAEARKRLRAWKKAERQARKQQ